ncbi:MAG TPA: M20/M25/M40 family metallo-hydrolase [Catalimonadaceae bacterium]|jgi:putative aminopeptidase FrvX|nr:M20/M25/M40 family metallo-hydrolase [Catalimonadaceae bacterium]
MKLLEQLCRIPGTSGDEKQIRDFLIQYFQENAFRFRQPPVLHFGKGFQDSLLVVFGHPKQAYFAHLDTIGYTAQYDNHLVPIGGPDGKNGDLLVFEIEDKTRECRLVEDEDELLLVDYSKTILPGTTLRYKPTFKLDGDWIKSPYLDNRLGVWALLQLAERVENVAFAFTTYEEHGGGTAGLLARKLYLDHSVSQVLVTDVTWSTKGVFPGKGPVVSLRDSRIPRKSYSDAIRQHLTEKQFSFQLEVEGGGGSDGREIQNLPFPIDWCFVGPPSENPHSSLEWVHRSDAEAFVDMLEILSTGVEVPD